MILVLISQCLTDAFYASFASNNDVLLMYQPLGKGLLQRLLLNLCAHTGTRANLVQLLLNMIRPEMETSPSELAITNPQRLYGCQSNVVYGRSQLLNGSTSCQNSLFAILASFQSTY